MADAMGLHGGPAFPISLPGVGDNGCPGMSLRDWFAGHVMERLISKCEDRNGSWDPDAVAIGAYEMADAMLRAREIPSVDFTPAPPRVIVPCTLCGIRTETFCQRDNCPQLPF